MSRLYDERYRLEAELGRGGMGAVYRAEDQATGRRCALKRLSTRIKSNPDAQLLFRQEFRRMSAIDHPHFTQAYDLGGFPHHPYFTMELVEGRPVNAEGRLSLAAYYDFATQLLQALSFLHARGWLHRDLKPDNLFITPEGKLKVMDLGLLFPLGQADEGHRRGTPAYLAPEIIRWEPLTEAADLYAFGVLSFELLTGERPFLGNVADLVHAHLREPPPPVEDLRPDIPKSLAQIVTRLMQKRPEDRYANAADVASDLSALLDRPISLETPEQRKSYLSTHRLVGREESWAPIAEALEGLDRGEGGAALISADSGIGKSRLLREARVEAQLRGYQVLFATARQGQNAPLSLLAGLFKSAAIEPDSLEEGALLLALQRVGRPILVCADDLQWADGPSLKRLVGLIRALRFAPVFVLGATRPGGLEASQPLWQLIDEKIAAHIKLEPFGPQKLRALLEAMLPGAEVPQRFVEEIYELSGGNAFFVDELLRALVDSERLGRQEGRFAYPESIKDMAAPLKLGQTIQDRAQGTPEAARKLLSATAVFQGAVPLLTLGRVAGLSDDEVLASFEILERKHLLQRAGEGVGVVDFVHSHARRLIYEGLSPEEARALHHRAAQLLEEAEAPDLPALAYHFSAAERGAEAIKYALAAAEEAMDKGAESEAFAHLKTAAKHLEAQAPEPTDELLAIYERVSGLSGAVWEDAPTCLRWFKRAIAIRRARGDDVFGMSLSSLITHTIAGYYAQAHEVLDALRPEVEEGSELWAVLHGVGACLLAWYEGDQRACQRYSTAAIEIFEGLLSEEDPPERFHPYAWSLFWREKARAYLGLPIEVSNIDKVAQMADVGRADPVILWHTRTAVGARAGVTGRMTDLEAWKALAEETSAAMGRMYWFECWVSHSWVYGLLGAFNLAPVSAHVERLFSSPDPYQRRLGLLFSGRLALAKGQLDEAKRWLREFIEAEETEGRDNSYAEGPIYLSLAHLAAGEEPEARALAEAGLADAEALDNPLLRLQFHRVLAECALQRGEIEAASAQLEVASALAEEGDNAIQSGWISLQQARLEQGTERIAKGLEEAREAFEALGYDRLVRTVQVVSQTISDPHIEARLSRGVGDQPRQAVLTNASLMTSMSLISELETHLG